MRAVALHDGGVEQILDSVDLVSVELDDHDVVPFFGECLREVEPDLACAHHEEAAKLHGVTPCRCRSLGPGRSQRMDSQR